MNQQCPLKMNDGSINLFKISAQFYLGADEEELDPFPWLIASFLMSITVFLCSLIVYKIIKRRQESKFYQDWHTHSTSNQGILISNNNFLFWSITTFSTFRTRDHGILISNHSSRVESSANGKFTFCTLFYVFLSSTASATFQFIHN